VNPGTGRKFQFLREIASGGFGSVYLAKVIHADGFARLAAIKLLHPKWSENQEIASRMRDEARLLGWLRHKNIVEVLDLTRIAGRVAVIMEYLEAVDLKIVVQALAMRDREVPLRASLEICAAVASALDAAYNRPPYAGEKPLRVIHRDIKPSNVMIDGSGTVKVLDFGVARADFDERESRTQEMSFGSLEYMPPERLFFEPDTPKSDVYSLGATLFEMLSLQKLGKARLRDDDHTAFHEERWADLRGRRAMPSPEIEAELRDVLFSMLAFDGDSRPSSADAVVKLRTLARKCPDDGVAEWSEVAIPPLVQAFAGRTVERGPDSLMDQVLAEDSRGFGGEDASSVQGEKLPALPTTPPLDEDDEEDDVSGRMSDEQWKKLKQATLADLEPPEVPRTPPPQRPPARRSGTSPPTSRPPSLPEQPSPVFTPPPSLPPDPEPQRGGGGLLAIAVLGGFFLFVVGIGAVILAVGGASFFAGGSDEPVTADVRPAPAPPKPAPAKTEPPKAEAPKAEAPKAEAPKVEAKAEPPKPAPIVGAVFKSAAPDTKKLTVRCDQGEGEGATEAVVASEKPGDCTVTALDTSRKRFTAIVKGVKIREYTCFEGGAKECR
jgi:serine/threonine protein kinase